MKAQAALVTLLGMVPWVMSPSFLIVSNAEPGKPGEVRLPGDAEAEFEQALRVALGPAAVERVAVELADQLVARQRLALAAAHVRLAQLDDAAAAEADAKVAGVVGGIFVVRIDHVADAPRQREDPGVARLLVGELLEAGGAIEESDRHAEGHGEFR